MNYLHRPRQPMTELDKVLSQLTYGELCAVIANPDLLLTAKPRPVATCGKRQGHEANFIIIDEVADQGRTA